MRTIKVIVTTMFFSCIIAFSGFAGQWKQDTNGWWYENEVYDGYSSYPSDTWRIIDKKEYYFNADGYIFQNAEQDGCWFGDDGARSIPDIGLENAPYKLN
ncbi:MAG: hypothetical protein ACRDBO_16475 [Lachnospiraceae bacterium]